MFDWLQLTIITRRDADRYYHKELHLGCCSSHGSTTGNIVHFPSGNHLLKVSKKLLLTLSYSCKKLHLRCLIGSSYAIGFQLLTIITTCSILDVVAVLDPLLITVFIFDKQIVYRVPIKM